VFCGAFAKFAGGSGKTAGAFIAACGLLTGAAIFSLLAKFAKAEKQRACMSFKMGIKDAAWLLVPGPGWLKVLAKLFQGWYVNGGSSVCKKL